MMIAAVSPGDIYTSVDSGEHWTKRTPVANQQWQAVASSADGQKLLAAINGDVIYRSTDAGVTWTSLIGSVNAHWQALASSADGKNLAAVAKPGAIYVSNDSGTTWDLRGTAPPNANWQGIASSTNGVALAAVEAGGHIYTSTDSGGTWTVRENTRGWSAIASSADGTRLLASESNGASQLYTIIGDVITPTITYDPNANFILIGGAKYLTATFDTALGDVPIPFPLRLIVHKASDGSARLLQHVFIGPDKLTTNSILTEVQTNLHSAFLDRARRITAVHLPISDEGWPLKGSFGPLGILNAALTVGNNDRASNPFLHSYHPDHDNLDAQFQQITKAGVESYDIKRQITLSFTQAGDDFTSRTAGASRLQGTYLENIVLKGSDNQTRTVVTKGDFILTRVSDIATIQ